MRLYSGTTKQFIRDTQLNQIAEKLKLSFFDQMGFNPSPSEIRSWRNSLLSMASAIEYSELLDHGVILEYQIPLTSLRLDCLLSGTDKSSLPNAVIVELKQWELCHRSECDNEVVTYTGGAEREVLHPSVQVGRYRQYLQDIHTAFYEGSSPVNLSACSYLHNYSFHENDPLFDNKFNLNMQNNPVFSKDNVPNLSEFLRKRLEGGNGLEVLKSIEQSEYRPSKKLMDHVGNIIKGKDEYVLMDEQQVVYDKVVTIAKNSYHDKKKAIIIVKGGPGTGKSVIAINLMADLLLDGYNAHYATGSRAFTQTLRKIIGSRGACQFKYFNSYMKAEPNEVDVLICDEAHRIRKFSHSRFTKRADRTNLPQIHELVNASKVCVFFIDDFQIVRPQEIGSVDYIRDYTISEGIQAHEYELDVQFRCSGSEAFVNWVNNTLAIRRTANPIWTGEDEFDFRIIESPEKLEELIIKRNEQDYTARLTAGFCWPWSKPKQDGTLVNDVKLGKFERPWNAKSRAGRLAKGIPKESLWAYDPNGVHQVGCIYTAQGFEFDYVGVIFGKDLVYRFSEGSWIGQKKVSFDTVVKRSKGKFLDLVKNTYRVLLTRGMKGCYVYFMDQETEQFFKARMEYGKSSGERSKVAEDKTGLDLE